MHRDGFSICFFFQMVLLLSFLKVPHIQGKAKYEILCCYTRYIKGTGKILLFSDINLYYTPCEWKSVDGHESEWLPCVGRLNKLKRWLRELSQESVEIMCGTDRTHRN